MAPSKYNHFAISTGKYNQIINADLKFLSTSSIYIKFTKISVLIFLLAIFLQIYHQAAVDQVALIIYFASHAASDIYQDNFCRLVHLSITKWVIPENIHTLPRAASTFLPPVAFGIPKSLTPPSFSEFQIFFFNPFGNFYLTA